MIIDVRFRDSFLMIRRGIAMFCIVLMAGIGGAAAQDVFLKYKKDEGVVGDSKPSIYIVPKGGLAKAGKEKPPTLVTPEIVLKNKELQKSANQKIKAFKEWNEKGPPPKTPEEFRAYAELSRSITQAQNYQRREVLYAQLAEQEQEMQKKIAAMQKPVYSGTPVKQSADTENSPQKEDSKKSVYNNPKNNFKKPAKTFSGPY